MKNNLLSVASTVVFACGPCFAQPTLPDFNSKTLGHPPLSLHDLTKGGITAPPQSFQSESWPQRPALAVKSAPQSRVRRESGLPILTPDPSIDYKTIVKAPDPTIDYKMLVKPVAPASTGPAETEK